MGQLGSHELRAGHPVPDERGAVFTPRPEGVGELKRAVVVPSRAVGRKWGRTVKDICWHRRSQYELHAERKAYPRRYELYHSLYLRPGLTPSCAGVLSDATKSVSRAYINNFQDKGKQIAIDMFLVGLVTFNFSPRADMLLGES
jgi:hypothetical protein